MKLISTIIGIGVAAWAVSLAMRPTERSRKRHTTRDAVTRWEGEGGAIPALASESTPPTQRDAAALEPAP